MTRLLIHFINGIKELGRPRKVTLPINRYGLWWIECGFYLLDIIALPEMYETIMDFSKWKTRPLSDREIELAKSVFGNSIDLRRVRVDESAKIACQHHHIYYVSFFTINAWGTFQKEIFIHELMHVWQFQRMGSVYIPQALLAQKTWMGYNYGGEEVLRKVIETKGGLDVFNLEQQADIVSDYYNLREGLMPRWCTPYKSKLLPLFEYFIEKIRLKNMN